MLTPPRPRFSMARLATQYSIWHLYMSLICWGVGHWMLQTTMQTQLALKVCFNVDLSWIVDNVDSQTPILLEQPDQQTREVAHGIWTLVTFQCHNSEETAFFTSCTQLPPKSQARSSFNMCPVADHIFWVLCQYVHWAARTLRAKVMEPTFLGAYFK